VSQLDQTKFKTVLKGAEVAREFQLTGEQRQVKGDSFTLLLLAEITHGDEKPFPIIVDRQAQDELHVIYRFENGGMTVKTTARLEPDGESFGIDILMSDPLQMKAEGAEVLVSEDMERLILERDKQEIENLRVDCTET
jgi:hypothetical protein